MSVPVRCDLEQGSVKERPPQSSRDMSQPELIWKGPYGIEMKAALNSKWLQGAERNRSGRTSPAVRWPDPVPVAQNEPSTWGVRTGQCWRMMPVAVWGEAWRAEPLLGDGMPSQRSRWARPEHLRPARQKPKGGGGGRATPFRNYRTPILTPPSPRCRPVSANSAAVTGWARTVTENDTNLHSALHF